MVGVMSYTMKHAKKLLEICTTEEEEVDTIAAMAPPFLCDHFSESEVKFDTASPLGGALSRSPEEKAYNIFEVCFGDERSLEFSPFQAAEIFPAEIFRTFPAAEAFWPFAKEIIKVV